MKQLLTTLLLIFSVLSSCGKPQHEGYVITPPSQPSSSSQNQNKPEDPNNNPENPGTPSNPATPPDGYIIVGYITSWSNVMPNPTYLTHINYAFGKVDSDFETLMISESSRLKKIVALKDSYPNLKVCLSIGGWGAGNFSEMAASETHRKKFCQNCAKAVQEYKLDGIDLDWEYPTSNSAGISSSPDDTKNFTQLVKDLRTTLGSNKLLTMASASNAKYVEFKDFIDQMNFVNLMTYDMGDPPQHNAALYKSSKTYRSCDESVTLHLSKGIPAEKIVLGMPFYGRDDEKTKPFTAGSNDNFIYYNKITKGSFHEQWDQAAKVPFLTDALGTMVLSYDNETSIGLKADYVKQKGLKGAMYWAIEGDDANWTLSKAIASRLIGWVPSEEPEDQNAFLATNQYVQKFLEEVNYPCTNSTDTDAEYSYSSVIGYPGGGPSEKNIEVPPTYTISWTASSSAQKLTVSEGDWNRDYSLSAGVGKQDITNLVPGTTYKWTVTTTSGSSVASGSFKTRGKLHQVYFEPNVRNGRDLGGYKGLNGKTVVYHKLYRGGLISKKYCNSDGVKEMLAEGILAELDLQEEGAASSSSPLGNNIAFYAPHFNGGYNEMVRDNPDKVRDAFKFVVQCLRENKPVYFHCWAGRDRTGTMAILLEGALGVSESDMAKDYELTYFSPTDWGMSKKKDENGNYVKDANGNYVYEYKHVRTAYSYKSVRKTIFKETDSGTYQERIVKYLLKIGVPQKDIDDLRNIMLK